MKHRQTADRMRAQDFEGILARWNHMDGGLSWFEFISNELPLYYPGFRVINCEVTIPLPTFGSKTRVTLTMKNEDVTFRIRGSGNSGQAAIISAVTDGKFWFNEIEDDDDDD